jgi:tripartite-type tricarboxylate transporter receptor subunit TctC
MTRTSSDFSDCCLGRRTLSAVQPTHACTHPGANGTNSWWQLAAVLFFLISGLCGTDSAFADPYPTHPIRIVVPYAPGGNSDVIARMLAAKMTESLEHPVLVENRPGASAIVGSEYVAKSPPDGYTLLMISSGNLATNPTLFPHLPYDTIKDFTPISNVAYTSYVLEVHPALPVKSVKELIDLAKSQPGKIDAGIPGIGTSGHLAFLLFTRMSGTSFTEVPFNGAAPALASTIAGQTKVFMDAISTSLQNLRAGNLRALGISDSKRSPLLPEVPTIAEAGLPGYEAIVYNALLGPAGLPQEIVDKLQTEIAKAGRQPDVQRKFAELGITMTASRPEELRSLIEKETTKWSKLVTESGIKPQ